jgi:hypothetical protein
MNLLHSKLKLIVLQLLFQLNNCISISNENKNVLLRIKSRNYNLQLLTERENNTIL